MPRSGPKKSYELDWNDDGKNDGTSDEHKKVEPDLPEQAAEFSSTDIFGAFTASQGASRDEQAAGGDPSTPSRVVLEPAPHHHHVQQQRQQLWDDSRYLGRIGPVSQRCHRLNQSWLLQKPKVQMSLQQLEH